MTITLTRTDSTRNLCRFYCLDVQPDLFGQWCVIREWGRIGSHGGQMRSEAYPSPDAARTALEKQRRAKMRRGYQ